MGGCSCTAQLDAASAAKVALKALKNATSVDEFYYAIGALAALHHDKALPKSAGQGQVGQITDVRFLQ